MKFGYSYKTSDGVRHEGTFEAKSNDAVFAALREKGIRPMKVWEIHSPYYISKRTRLIVVLAIVAIAAIIAAIRAQREVAAVKIGETTAPRHQIYGDPSIWEELERDDFAAVFPDTGDRILALYAIPGRSEPSTLRLPYPEIIKALAAAKDKDVEFLPDEPKEAAELKRIVQGMKEEFRWYVADGEGTVETYLQRLRERQSEEIRIYERTCKELENNTDRALREERNAALRAMGLRTIPKPKSANE